MFFRPRDIDIWRKVVTSGLFVDESWAYYNTISVTKQPFTGDDSYKMGQIFENVRDLIVCDIDADILKTDILYYDSDYHRIQYIHNYDSELLPHKEILTTDSQWRP